MPNYFTLTPVDGDKPAAFADIDDRMREHFGVEPDSEKFYLSWYDTVGLALALGRSWDEIKALDFWSDDEIAMIAWLSTNYTPDAWSGRH